MAVRDNLDTLLRDLQERQKELNCIYRIEEFLSQPDASLDQLLQGVVEIIPQGWQYVELCQARIVIKDRKYETPGFQETAWTLQSNIEVQGERVGTITVAYSHEVPQVEGMVFLPDEVKLIKTIADRLSFTFLHFELKRTYSKWKGIREELSGEKPRKWRAIMDTLRRSDRNLFIYISRKMLRNLCLSGNEDANKLLKTFNLDDYDPIDKKIDVNKPILKQKMRRLLELCDQIFQIAAQTMEDDAILGNIEEWIQEDKSKFLVKAIDNPNSSLHEIIDAITRYRYIEAEGLKLSSSIRKGLRVSLIRRFFSDQLEFINVAKNYIEVNDYYDLISRVIFHENSRGSLGGKSAGLFLASRILAKSLGDEGLPAEIRIPKTWYVTSDGLIHFLYYNDLEEVNEQKYKSAEEIRFEYPNLIQIFKNAQFPARIVAGLKTALEEIGDHPIIVRSSSLLEDRLGSAFSGKYKSLFLANKGSKEDRLEDLKDAIAEIYASTFAPDPIQYRHERGFLDFNEEMGIMIQEVVGTTLGNYFLPVLSGVAFSNNEFPWSPRIERKDGLIRMTFGLGTRVVDRVSDDYPILLAPGKPGLRVNQTPEEAFRYSPQKADAINLRSNQFETVSIEHLIRNFGNELPIPHYILSTVEDDFVQTSTTHFNVDFEKNTIVTFEGLLRRTPFASQIKSILDRLQEVIGTPVDIEFAHDGKYLYLLQCRPQSQSSKSIPLPIPRDVLQENILFSTDRYVYNGTIPEIRFIVYVDPEGYHSLSSREELMAVGRAVGKLNSILPKREFILMGPGRWGSRGDIKLGVQVTYSEINNAALLVEIAYQKGNFAPELSFGTHFFQDLVESSIRYLPLYPDERGIFNKTFLSGAENSLSSLCPEFSNLSGTVRVIDVPAVTRGSILRIVLNGDEAKALAYFDKT